MAAEVVWNLGRAVAGWLGSPIAFTFLRKVRAAKTPVNESEHLPGLCADAEQACREVVNLPTHLRAGVKTARRSVEFIRRLAGPEATRDA